MRTSIIVTVLSVGILSVASPARARSPGARTASTRAKPAAGYRIGNVNVRVVKGDLMQTRATALVTAINSGGPMYWNGKIDRVMMRTVGPGYHQQLNNKLGQFGDLRTVVATGRRYLGRNAFDNVIFVGDNLRAPLNRVVCNGLECANRKGYSSVSMPAMRMGVMRGAVERTTQETMDRMVQGIKSYATSAGAAGRVREVTIVVHSNQDTIDALNTALSTAASR
jgi:O-acetyl-ADP-ribose deacetylase (regulator of RNase III)